MGPRNHVLDKAWAILGLICPLKSINNLCCAVHICVSKVVEV